MAIEVRTCAPDEVGRALDGIWHYFGGRASEEDVERFAPILPPERVHAAIDDGAITRIEWHPHRRDSSIARLLRGGDRTRVGRRA